MSSWLLVPLITLLVCATLLALAIALGGPAQPPPMTSITAPFAEVDYARLPAVRRVPASDGTPLAYREYLPDAAAPARGSVVLVHGSSADGASMHPLAMALQQAGWQVLALDMRGHGATGVRGRLERVGQLEDDVAALVARVQPRRPSTLVGFSSGGGFVLRHAAGPQRASFDSYLMLAPFIGQDAPSQRPGSGGWVSVGVPRLVALTILQHLGLRAFERLPVMRFALDEEARHRLTPSYDLNLATNFRPRPDWRADMRAVDRPIAIVAGARDEAFLPERYEPVLRQLDLEWPVRLVPGVGHVGITLEPEAMAVVAESVARLQSETGDAASTPRR